MPVQADQALQYHGQYVVPVVVVGAAVEVVGARVVEAVVVVVVVVVVVRSHRGSSLLAYSSVGSGAGPQQLRSGELQSSQRKRYEWPHVALHSFQTVHCQTQSLGAAVVVGGTVVTPGLVVELTYTVVVVVAAVVVVGQSGRGILCVSSAAGETPQHALPGWLHSIHRTRCARPHVADHSDHCTQFQ